MHGKQKQKKVVVAIDILSFHEEDEAETWRNALAHPCQ